jgi:hypothetical protein
VASVGKALRPERRPAASLVDRWSESAGHRTRLAQRAERKPSQAAPRTGPIPEVTAMGVGVALVGDDWYYIYGVFLWTMHAQRRAKEAG